MVTIQSPVSSDTVVYSTWSNQTVRGVEVTLPCAPQISPVVVELSLVNMSRSRSGGILSLIWAIIGLYVNSSFPPFGDRPSVCDNGNVPCPGGHGNPEGEGQDAWKVGPLSHSCMAEH